MACRTVVLLLPLLADRRGLVELSLGLLLEGLLLKRAVGLVGQLPWGGQQSLVGIFGHVLVPGAVGDVLVFFKFFEGLHNHFAVAGVPVFIFVVAIVLCYDHIVTLFLFGLVNVIVVGRRWLGGGFDQLQQLGVGVQGVVVGLGSDLLLFLWVGFVFLEVVVVEAGLGGVFLEEFLSEGGGDAVVAGVLAFFPFDVGEGVRLVVEELVCQDLVCGEGFQHQNLGLQVRQLLLRLLGFLLFWEAGDVHGDVPVDQVVRVGFERHYWFVIERRGVSFFSVP